MRQLDNYFIVFFNKGGEDIEHIHIRVLQKTLLKVSFVLLTAITLNNITCSIYNFEVLIIYTLGLSLGDPARTYLLITASKSQT